MDVLRKHLVLHIIQDRAYRILRQKRHSTYVCPQMSISLYFSDLNIRMDQQ
jgi:hypothetical protein